VSRKALLIVSVSLLSCFGLAMAQPHSAHDRAYPVSLIRLIANPKVFDGRRLRLSGYLDYNGIDRAVGLYVTELDGQNFIISNSVDLRFDESSVDKLTGKYVILEGTFHAPIGPLADYINGYLDHVSKPKIWAQGDAPK
jgi:hypothetical protein